MKDAWTANLSEEADFWWRYLTEEKFSPDRAERLDSSHGLGGHLEPLLPPNQDVYAVLDVGSGPASGLGGQIPGKLLNLYLTDPLAHQYNRMLNQLGITTAIRPIAVEGERLTAVFPNDFFDLVVCTNALDHSYDPLRVLQEMLAVCKPGCWIYLLHHNNVAEIENYHGLHQWNLDLDEGRFILWNRNQRIDLVDAVGPVGGIRFEQIPMADVPPLFSVFLQKRT